MREAFRPSGQSSCRLTPTAQPCRCTMMAIEKSPRPAPRSRRDRSASPLPQPPSSPSPFPQPPTLSSQLSTAWIKPRLNPQLRSVRLLPLEPNSYFAVSPHYNFIKNDFLSPFFFFFCYTDLMLGTVRIHCYSHEASFKSAARQIATIIPSIAQARDLLAGLGGLTEERLFEPVFEAQVHYYVHFSSMSVYASPPPTLPPSLPLYSLTFPDDKRLQARPVWPRHRPRLTYSSKEPCFLSLDENIRNQGRAGCARGIHF